MEHPIVVLYHGGCSDGFSGAYAAWKKFGDSATYVPLARGEEPPYQEVTGKHAYFIDFCYPQDIMDRFVAEAAAVTVLDHHEGVSDVITSMPEYVYQPEHSGAVIAWQYFHPDTPVPQLLLHVEDIDLYRLSLPDTRPLITYLEVQPMTFETWDHMATMLDDATAREQMLETARMYTEYFEKLSAYSIEHAKLVSFEGHEIFFATTHPIKSMKSYVGNQLVQKHGPFALIVTAHPNGYGVSIRGDGSVNVADIAQKYGGNGHPNAAGFLIPREGPFPWTAIEHEDSRD